MKKILIAFLLTLSLLFLLQQTVFAKEKQEVNFFYSITCPHCIREQAFLDKLEKKYSEVKINRYQASKNSTLLEQYYQKYQVPPAYQGAVPITFIKDKFFLGFNDEIGKQMEDFLIGKVKKNPSFIERLKSKNYSLPVLAIILGALDGFNICSLGALLIILTLVLSLRSRQKIFIFGGTYLLVTAVTYGLLIFFWYQLFNIISPYLRNMEIVIGLITAIGAFYFFKEFLKAYRYGPNCEIDEGKKLSGKFSVKFRKMIEENKKLLPVVFSVLIFAATITLVEFPCSAAVPLVFAGILAKAQLPTLVYILYIVLFIIFYLLDELIVFLIAVFTMKLWLSSPKFVTWITLVQAIIMAFLSLHYLFGLI